MSNNSLNPHPLVAEDSQKPASITESVKSRRKNILFATVRQGNCGDEFILFGTQNIISSLQPDYNPIIVNKNVEVCRRLQFRNKTLDIEIADPRKKLSLNLEKVCFRDEPLEDNSFADYYSLDFIDAVVFAGTPEWLVYKLLPLYEKLAAYDKPILFLGPGYHEGFDRAGPWSGFSEIYKRVHKKAAAFIVRDRLLLEYLKPEVEATLLPCPALLCSKTHRERGQLKRIGFSLQAKAGDARVNSVPPETYHFCLRLLEEISKHWEVEVVCHWIEDLISLGRDLGARCVLRYSYDARDYFEFYDSYDLVISTRVHGSGMAASLGIPTYTISHSARTDTVRGFCSHIITPQDRIDSILEAIRSMDLKEESSGLIAHKESTMRAYQEMLRPCFPL